LSEGQVLHSFPQFLPDGRLFVFFVTGAEGERGIHLGSLDDPASRRLTPADTAAVLSPDGWLLYLRQGTLVAHRFDATTATLSGEPITITDRVRFGSGVWNIGAFSAAQGMIAYRAGERSRRQLTWFSRAGRSLGTFGPPDDGDLLNPELSPDGQRVAVQRTVQNNDDIFVFDGARRTRFTTDAERETYPVWSPTADRIAYSFTRSGNAQIFEKPSTGGNAQQLLQSSGANVITDWSLDGRYVLYFQPDPNTGTDLWVLTVGQKPALFLRTPFTEAWGRFSPDGRWVAYQSDESGTRNEIYVKPFRPDALVSESATGSSSASAGQQVSTEGGISPRWSRDGKELYYVAPGGMLMAAPITAKGATLVVGTPVALFHSRIVGGGSTGGVGIRQQYDVASDGRFLVNVSLEDSTASPITLLLNWKPDK
jgi:dipeptidyl aminopeptidase/acylaminoacyl peptidase